MGGFVDNVFSQGSRQGQQQAINEGKSRRAEDKAKKRQKRLDALTKDQSDAALSARKEDDKRKRRIGASAQVSSDQGRLEAPNIGRRRLSV